MQTTREETWLYAAAKRVVLVISRLSALLCVYLNYKIADLAFGSVRVNVLTMFCTAAFFPMAFLTSMIYGDLPSWVLCWLSVWRRR